MLENRPPSRSVLVVNTGSSSLKWVVLDAADATTQHSGEASWSGSEGGRHSQELDAALEHLPKVDAVGHRVVHGGTRFRDSVLVDDTVREAIAALADLAPLHNPAALAGIDAARARFPHVPQVAAFDTAFHATIPDRAALYALPWDWTTRWELRRFGFHGLSVEYTVRRLTSLLGQLPPRLVVCHLGAGCSATAVSNGRSADTSMGFTPLEGLVMARRSGSVDPGLLLYLERNKGLDPETLEHVLNEESGLGGVSGIRSGDMREILGAADRSDERASVARDMFVHRLVSTIGGLAAGLDGLDALVFTGGIGEHSAPIRAQVCASLTHLGVRLDPSANESRTLDTDVASPSSQVRVVVVTAREDVSILHHVTRLLAWQ